MLKNGLVLDSAAEECDSDQEGIPPFTLHIGMLYTAICRLVRIQFIFPKQ